MRKRNVILGLSVAMTLALVGEPMALFAEAPDLEQWEASDFSDEILYGTSDLSEEEIYTGEADVEESEMQPGTMEEARSGTLDLESALKAAEGYLQSTVTDPAVNTIHGEWSVLAMARAGYLTDAARKAYLTNLYHTLQETGGVLHQTKYTEYSRVVLALSSMNVDPQQVNGYNLLKPLAEFEKVVGQGINGAIYALLALDSKQYEIPEVEGAGTETTRERLISYILGQEVSGGGWSLSGDQADPDMTAMAIQSLAPYRGQEQVLSAVNRGIDRLASMQLKDGGYASEDAGRGTKNLESTAQVVIALSTVDASILEEERFQKNGKTLLDELLAYQQSDGSFSHVKNGNADPIATDQGTLAAVAWTRAVGGQTPLYDMTDIGGAAEEESGDTIEAFRKKLDALPTLQEVTLQDRELVEQLKVELSLLRPFAEKEVFEEKLNTYMETLRVQEEEVKRISDRIWEEVNLLEITLEKKQTIESIEAEYQRLPEENKSFVTGREELQSAKRIVKKLEEGILSEELLKKVKEARKEYCYQGAGYTIRIKGEHIAVPRDMKIGVTVQETENTLQFQMEEEKLPGEIELSLVCDLEDGTYALFDEAGRQNQWLEVSEGIASCNLIRGGSYQISRAEVKDQTETDEKAGGAVGGRIPAGSAKKSSSGNSEEEKSNTVQAKVKDGIVGKEQVKAIQGKDKNLKVQGEMAKGQAYTLILHGKDIRTVKDFKVGLKKGSSHEEEMQILASGEAYPISFEEKGSFPGKMFVELPVDLKDGNYLLLHYREQEKKAEYIQKVTVKENRTRFVVEKGGDYFFAKKVSSKSVEELQAEKNSIEEIPEEEVFVGTQKKTNVVGIKMVAVVLAAGVVVWIGRNISKRRKRKDEETK